VNGETWKSCPKCKSARVYVDTSRRTEKIPPDHTYRRVRYCVCRDCGKRFVVRFEVQEKPV